MDLYLHVLYYNFHHYAPKNAQKKEEKVLG